MHTLIVAFFTISLGLRLYRIDYPAHVCWDEVHFGKYASYYINRTLFFDVHPPLGKMMLAFAGHLSGYDGSCLFDKPGDSLDGVMYIGMRQIVALFGSAVVPLSMIVVWELSSSPLATIMTGCFILSDTALTVVSRFILLDAFMLFFILSACLFYLKHRKCQPFSSYWWIGLILCGLSIGCALGVKFIALFVVAFIGLNVISDLWTQIREDIPCVDTVQHILARVYTLVILPLLTYCFAFVLHFILLNNSGPGDGFHSSLFQSTLIGNPLHHVTIPEYVAYGSAFTLRSHRINGGFLSSHDSFYPIEAGAAYQQVTGYHFRDDRNYWNFLSPSLTVAEKVIFVKDGDSVWLSHNVTRKGLVVSELSAPVTKNHWKVACLQSAGDSNEGDYRLFQIKVVSGLVDDNRISPVLTTIQIVNTDLQCALQISGRQLPKWGNGLNEVTCNPNLKDPNTHWNIEHIEDHRVEEVRVDWKGVRPGFINKFIESHRVILHINRSLKPATDQFVSRPWMWPVSYRGELFSLNPTIVMLTNPFISWLILVVSLASLLLFVCDSVYNQRLKAYNQDGALIKYAREYRAMGWLLAAFCFNYLPFFPMTRALFPHHYLTAFVFSCMLTAISLEHMLRRLLTWASVSHVNPLLYLICSCACLYSLVSFYFLSPLVYGYDETGSNTIFELFISAHRWY